jgi:hypothetical protein
MVCGWRKKDVKSIHTCLVNVENRFMDDLFVISPVSPIAAVHAAGAAGLAEIALRVEDVRAREQRSGLETDHEGVRVSISPAARAYARQSSEKELTGISGSRGLTPEEEQVVREMAEQDRKVRSHEQAHLAVGAGLARGGPNYSYRSGPDGKRYVVSGEVNIDVSPVRDDPDATIRKAHRVRAAALAPADPSPQDRQVAVSADRMEMQAQLQKTISRSGLP